MVDSEFGEGRFKFGVSFIVESVVRLILSVTLVWLGFKVYGAMIGVFLGVSLGFLIAFFFIRNVMKQKEQKDYFNEIYKFSIPFFITT